MQAVMHTGVDKSAYPVFICYSIVMSIKKLKRLLATSQVRIYPETLRALQEMSLIQGKTISRLIHEAVTEYAAQ